MKIERSTKQMVRYSILALFALLCVLMLSFSTLYACTELSRSVYPKGDSGFVWMTIQSNIAYGSEWDAFAVVLGVLSIFQFVFGLIAVALVVVNFLTNKPAAKNKGIIIVGFISMLLYAMEGIIYKMVYCDIMGYQEQYFATASYIPLIIGIILMLGFVLSGKIFKENRPAPVATPVAQPAPVVSQVNEGNTINNLAEYKKLLDAGVITQEEFDAKKKQLLGF